jgi:hypothetical protein
VPQSRSILVAVGESYYRNDYASIRYGGWMIYTPSKEKKIVQIYYVMWLPPVGKKSTRYRLSTVGKNNDGWWYTHIRKQKGKEDREKRRRFDFSRLVLIWSTPPWGWWASFPIRELYAGRQRLHTRLSNTLVYYVSYWKFRKGPEKSPVPRE